MSNPFNILEDESLMPDNGRHKGEKMANIPARDLLWLYDNNCCTPRVKYYIEQNMYDLRQEAMK